MKLILVLLFSSTFARASLPELFGSSAANIAIGNQAGGQTAANNTYAASLLGYSEKTQFSFNTFYIATKFRSIDNVITRNQTNTVNAYGSDNVHVNNTPSMMFGAHLSTPLFSPTGPKLGLSAFAPFDRLMEADTGDPYQPSYVMYNSRLSRPVLMFNGAQAFGDWSFSAGAMTGFQSNGETTLMTRTTSGNPSVGKISFNAKPSLGFLASVAKKSGKQTTYLAYQQQMKSKLVSHATGETEIAANASFAFDFHVSSLLYYDPMTLRLGHQIEKDETNLFFSLEYQNWQSYQSGQLKLQKEGGIINGSENYETIKLRNILIPKIGLERKLSDKWLARAGYFYRPTPIIVGNLKNAGNSIDVDKHVGSLGVAHLFTIFEKVVTLDFAYQAHFLKQGKVTKTPNREDGTPGQSKIGSPGYRIGGMIHALSLGLTWMY